MTIITTTAFDDDTPATRLAYVLAAGEIYGRDGEIEIDHDAKISRGDESGAYVQAWVWVYDDQLGAGIEPSFDVWMIEPGADATRWDDWRFQQRFTCKGDTDGAGARQSAHEYARHLRKAYPCAYVAVRPAGKKPLDVDPPKPQ